MKSKQKRKEERKKETLQNQRVDIPQHNCILLSGMYNVSLKRLQQYVLQLFILAVAYGESNISRTETALSTLYRRTAIRTILGRDSSITVRFHCRCLYSTLPYISHVECAIVLRNENNYVLYT